MKFTKKSAPGQPTAMSSGVGESKIFATGEGNPANEALTVNGEPIPEGLRHAIPYRNTDQGIAEQEAKVDKSLPRIEIRDEFDRKLEGLADENDMQPWEAKDPLAHLKATSVPVGHRGKLLSDNVVSRKGLRGWKPVIGENGEPVKLGNMTLASMPIERAEKRNAHYAEQSREAVGEVKDSLRESQARLIRDSGGGLAALRPGETIERQFGHTLTETESAPEGGR